MEIEEAIKLLKANGYSVIKKPEPVKLLPCVCGRKRIDLFYTFNGLGSGRFYKCPKCGLTSNKGKNEREAKILWNIRVSRRSKQAEEKDDDPA